MPCLHDDSDNFRAYQLQLMGHEVMIKSTDFYTRGSRDEECIFFPIAAFISLPWYTSLSNDKILDVTKLKAFADNKLNIAKMTIFLFDRVENTGGKGENAGCQHFLLSPPVFSKALFFRVVKSRDCV